MSRIRRSVRTWAAEAAEETSLWDFVVLFLMSVSLLIQKLREFWAGPVEEYEEFFESFSNLSLADGPDELRGVRGRVDEAPPARPNPDHVERRTGLIAGLPDSVSRGCIL